MKIARKWSACGSCSLKLWKFDSQKNVTQQNVCEVVNPVGKNAGSYKGVHQFSNKFIAGLFC
jgi:hypothetical protein